MRWLRLLFFVFTTIFRIQNAIKYDFVFGSRNWRHYFLDLLSFDGQLLVLATLALAERRAANVIFKALAVVSVTSLFAAAAFTVDLAHVILHTYDLRVEGVRVDLFGLLDDKSSSFFVLEVVVAIGALTVLRAIFQVLETPAMEAQALGHVTTAADSLDLRPCAKLSVLKKLRCRNVAQ